MWIRNHLVLNVFTALGHLPVISLLGLLGDVEAVVIFGWMVEHHSLPL